MLFILFVGFVLAFMLIRYKNDKDFEMTIGVFVIWTILNLILSLA